MIFESMDHTETGVDRLTYKLKQPEIEKLLTLFLTKQDELEAAITEIGNIKDLDTVTGIWLDYIGKIVGEDRNNLTDEAYRAMLKTRIAINTTNGTPDSMIDLITLYTESSNVILAESGMAFGTIAVTGGQNLSSDLYDLIQKIKPAATRWLVHSDKYDNAFIPAYEINAYEPELFQTTSDGTTYENFQTTSDGTTYNNFYVISATQGYYEDTIKGYRNTFYYEGDEGDDSYPRAKLHWEIDANSLERVNDGEADMLLYNDRYDSLSAEFTVTVDGILSSFNRTMDINNPLYDSILDTYELNMLKMYK